MSRYIEYLVLIISLYAIGVVSVSAECEIPECPLFESTMFPVPDDCTKFISCDNGVQVIQTCQEGLHFNPIELVCDWPISAGCVLCGTGTTDVPVTTDSPTTTDETTTDGPTTDGPTTTDGTITVEPEVCEIAECPILPANQFVFLRVPWDCNLYVMCFNGNVFQMNCSPDLVFDESAQACIAPAPGYYCDTCEVDGTTIEPEITTERPCEIEECSEEQETPLYLAVPWNCSKLVLCIRGHTFEETCGAGLHFSPAEQTCVLPENTVCEVCEQIELTTELEVTTETQVSSCEFAPCYIGMAGNPITAVPWNCSQYVICVNGQRTIYECSNGSYFDEVTQGCYAENFNNCVPCIQ